MDKIVLDLNNPGMTAHHRLGLGGLGCTLKSLERDARDGIIEKKDLPGKWTNNAPPWEVGREQIVLYWGETQEEKSAFMEKLLKYAIQVTPEKMLYFPGQWRYSHNTFTANDNSKLAKMHSAYLGTYIHKAAHVERAKVNFQQTIDPGEKEEFPDIEVMGIKNLKVLHQMIKNFSIPQKTYEIKSHLILGAAQKHSKFTTTTISEPIELFLPICFIWVGAIVTKFSKRVGKKFQYYGASVLPDIYDLKIFIDTRQMYDPPNECTGESDAIADYYCRMFALKAIDKTETNNCTVIVTRQEGKEIKKCHAFDVAVHDYEQIENFRDFVWDVLHPVQMTNKKGEKYWDNRPAIMRGIIADNILNDRPWFFDLDAFFSRNKSLPFQEEVIRVMDKMPTDSKYKDLIEAARATMGSIYAQIANENKNPGTRRNRQTKAKERFERMFLNARTHEQYLVALNLFFSHSRFLSVEYFPSRKPQEWPIERGAIVCGIQTYRPKAKADSEEIVVAEATA